MMGNVDVPAKPVEDLVASIHQPHYFPWLGLIAKVACSDVFVYLDDVQFEKNGWQNRTRYSTADGLRFLSVPVRGKGVVSGQKSIRGVELADQRAAIKHWKTLKQRYGQQPGWSKIADRLEAILTSRHETLLPLAVATTALTFEVFRLQPRIVFSSEIAAPGRKTERLINLVNAVGSDHYLSGIGAKEYIDQAQFERARLKLSYQQFVHPIYCQATGREFLPFAFALEWFMADPDGAADKLRLHLQKNSSQAPRCFV